VLCFTEICVLLSIATKLNFPRSSTLDSVPAGLYSFRPKYHIKFLVEMKKAIKINHPYTLDYVRTFWALQFNLKQDNSATLRLSEEVLTTSYDHGFIYWISMCEVLRGYSQYQLGLKEEGIARMREGLQLLYSPGVRV
jgi:hypothetical protein